MSPDHQNHAPPAAPADADAPDETTGRGFVFGTGVEHTTYVDVNGLPGMYFRTLATRAIAADPANRGAWHLWALTEANPRQRTARWHQVTKRFPEDQLAKALLADNAASLAGAEHDDEALVIAIATYEELLASADRPEQRAALEHALSTLRGWKL